MSNKDIRNQDFAVITSVEVSPISAWAHPKIVVIFRLLQASTKLISSASSSYEGSRGSERCTGRGGHMGYGSMSCEKGPQLLFGCALKADHCRYVHEVSSSQILRLKKDQQSKHKLTSSCFEV